MDSVSHDSISLRGAGIVTVLQQKKGARFNLDSLLLADFCRIKPWDQVLEPGAGTGIVALLLAKKFPRIHITAVELQNPAARLCRRNIEENQLEQRIKLFELDLRTLKRTLKASSLDVIVANPPYTRTGSGRQSPAPERQSSRHDRHGDLGCWLDLQRFLKNKGRYYLVFPADRLADLIASLRSRSLEPKRLRFVHPFKDEPASVVLLETVKAAGTGLQVLPPLVIHESGGGYTDEMKEMYGLPA